MAANRLFMNLSLEELQRLYENSIDDRIILNKISRELAHRTTKKSKLLRIQVRESVIKIEVKNGSQKSSSQSQSQSQSQSRDNKSSDQKSEVAFLCQSCRIKKKLNNEAKSGNYRCPSCKTKFAVSYLKGRLEIIFSANSYSSTYGGSEKELTFYEALGILDSRRSDSLDIIKQNYKKLMQQYHPDKVSSLGPKLRELASKEAQKINYAFQLVKKRFDT